MTQVVHKGPVREGTCATIGPMRGELKDPSISQSLPSIDVAGELAGALDARRPMPWLSWCMFVALGLGVTVGVAWIGSTLRPGRAARPARVADAPLLAEGVRAYDSGDWRAAVRAFERVLKSEPRHARALDYLDRIELTLQDADRLRLAEEALVAGQVFDAERLALAVPPNSPLYAQAEAVARTSRAQRERTRPTAVGGDAHEVAPAPALDIHTALGEALALYEASRFAEAADRALSLAEQATPETRKNLLSWAHDCRKFAQRYTHLPEDPLNLVRHTREVREAIELDEKLSNGHYARKLRAQSAAALSELARVLLDGGDALGGCEHALEAAELDPRGPTVEGLLGRCTVEAERKVTQARAIAAQRPEQALRLYRQVQAMSARNTRSYRSAEQAIESLSWSEER